MCVCVCVYVCVCEWVFARASCDPVLYQKMVDVKEQHICIKICFKLGKTGIETYFQERNNWQSSTILLVQKWSDIKK